MQRRIVSQCDADRASDVAGPVPERALAIVGDVHGCHDLLIALCERISVEAAQAQIVLVGDLVDRGPQSAQVLDWVAARQGDVVCIRGNHEEMFLSFLDRPDGDGQVWLDHGGLQTIESFGLRGHDGSRRPAALIALRDSLAAAVGPKLVSWLAGLPRWVKSGNVVVTHAGADPRRALDDQPPGGLVWGDPRWPDMPRSDGTWLVHGHYPLARCRLRNRHISVDTGAYLTGMLSAALIDAGSVRFLDVTRGSRP